MVGQQACKISREMDSGMRQTVGKADFSVLITQVTIVNIVMCGTQHNTADMGYSNTQTLLVTLTSQPQPQEVCCVVLEVELSSQSVGCARNKHPFRTERFVIGTISRRGQDTALSDRSPVVEARPNNLVMDGQCKEDVSPQRSELILWSIRGMKKSLSGQILGSSGSNFEVECSHVYRQEKVHLAARKLGQKGLTRPKSEEDSTCTGKHDVVSPDVENMRFSGHHYIKNITMHTEETGKNLDT